MEHLGKTSVVSVVFDYTSFLGACCNKKWTFLEAMSSFAPIFSFAWKDSIKERLSAEERLWELAMLSLSVSRSDEANILTLVELAKTEGVGELKIVMPYDLEQELLTRIKAKSHTEIQLAADDAILVKM